MEAVVKWNPKEIFMKIANELLLNPLPTGHIQSLSAKFDSPAVDSRFRKLRHHSHPQRFFSAEIQKQK